MCFGRVAPSAGAWIEIPWLEDEITPEAVAPSAGAWIEMKILTSPSQAVLQSLPLRERGLK